MHKTISSVKEFQAYWGGLTNFLMEGECKPFAYEMPSIARFVEELRHAEGTKVFKARDGLALDMMDQQELELFRFMPIEDVLQAAFSMAHYHLDAFYEPGKLLEGFDRDVLEPWKQFLREAGFTWDRCTPYIFISTPGCDTKYHMDFSHVLALQIHGTKLFAGLKDPERWAPVEKRIHSKGIQRPDGIAEDDVLAYEMAPGDVLWNTFLTPHWVNMVGEDIACSINISHGGLRYRGNLCKHEEEVERWKLEHPNDKIV